MGVFSINLYRLNESSIEPREISSVFQGCSSSNLTSFSRHWGQIYLSPATRTSSQARQVSGSAKPRNPLKICLSIRNDMFFEFYIQSKFDNFHSLIQFTKF